MTTPTFDDEWPEGVVIEARDGNTKKPGCAQIQPTTTTTLPDKTLWSYISIVLSLSLSLSLYLSIY